LLYPNRLITAYEKFCNPGLHFSSLFIDGVLTPFRSINNVFISSGKFPDWHEGPATSQTCALSASKEAVRRSVFSRFRDRNVSRMNGCYFVRRVMSLAGSTGHPRDNRKMTLVALESGPKVLSDESFGFESLSAVAPLRPLVAGS
jgi:hypothetical protein